jgi:ABC transporter
VPVLEADDLFRFFHPGDAEVRALRGASLSLERGETIALVGPSGSGKSTLLACLAGLDEPDGGMVRIDGAPMSRRPESERARLRGASIGFLAQANNLFEHLSVAENIWLQMELRGAAREDVRGLLGRVGLAERGHALPATLSGGKAHAPASPWRWPPIRGSFWRTSRPPRWTRKPKRSSSVFWKPGARTAARPLLQRTVARLPRMPREFSPSSMGASSKRRRPGPRRAPSAPRRGWSTLPPGGIRSADRRSSSPAPWRATSKATGKRLSPCAR